MKQFIPKLFIDSLIGQCDLVDLISGYVELKQRGHNYIGLCPFHSEHTPSFTVSQKKQLYHCFGCGESGNALTFLMRFRDIELDKAIEKLAGFLKVEMQYEPYVYSDDEKIDSLLHKLSNEELTTEEKRELQDFLNKKIKDHDFDR